MDKAPVQTAEAKPVEAEVKPEEAPERVEAEAVEVRHSEAPQDVEGEVQEKAPEEIPDEAVAQEPVFQEVETAPVKVGETYEPVDTQEPDMEAKLADTIRTAVQSGAEKVEIRLMPENLGRLTIEMTRDSRLSCTHPTAGRQGCSTSIWTACAQHCRTTASRRSAWRSSAARKASASRHSRTLTPMGAASAINSSSARRSSTRSTARTSFRSCA